MLEEYKSPLLNYYIPTYEGLNMAKKPLHEVLADADGSIVWKGKCYSIADLYRTAGRLAADLEDSLKPGSSAAIVMFNSVEFMVALMASWMSGARPVVIDALSMKEDLAFQLTDAKPSVVFASKAVVERERDVLSKLGVKVLTEEDITNPKSSHERVEKVDLDSDALVFYYAGIAGRTEQVLHSHKGVLAGLLSFSEFLGLSEKTVSLTVIPLTHVLGLNASTLSPLVSGGKVVLHERFSEEEAVKAINEYGVTCIIAVPLVFQRLLQAGFSGAESLEWGMSGGAPLPLEVQKTWRERTGTLLLQIYGMTEVFPVTGTRPGEHKDGSVGIPMPGVEVKLVDPSSPDRELGVGEVGELLVRGEMVMKGYADPEDTRNAFINGWLRTGDLLCRDEDGFFYFRGVRKRMIKYKGYPIFPRDLELILMEHPAVAKVRVEGKPAGDVGQIPVARIVLKPEYRGKVSPEDLMKFVNERVAPYKKIREVVFVEEL